MSPEIHARISKEEYLFLKSIGINKSQLIRDAIHKLMDELPENLEKRKNELLMEIEEINKKLKNLSKIIAEKKKYLDFIAEEFRNCGREGFSDAQNIEWLENRYREKLNDKDIFITPEALLKYCIKKAKGEK